MDDERGELRPDYLLDYVNELQHAPKRLAEYALSLEIQIEQLTQERDEARQINDGMARAPYGEFEKMRVERDEAWRRITELEADRDRLIIAIENYSLWEPGKKGHADAHRRLLKALSTSKEKT